MDIRNSTEYKQTRELGEIISEGLADFVGVLKKVMIKSKDYGLPAEIPAGLIMLNIGELNDKMREIFGEGISKMSDGIRGVVGESVKDENNYNQ